MAKKEFILQGFTDRTHLVAIRKLFDIPDIESVILSVAYVKASGVDLINKPLANCAAKVTVFAGIRNDITSRQAMVRLHSLGVVLYAVDTGSRNIVFHPKLYLARGKTCARLLIGSANLTIGGMNNNIEAGMAFDFDLSDETDKSVVDSIEQCFRSLPTDFPEHVLKITSANQLDGMQVSGQLVDEMALSPPRPRTMASGGLGDSVPRIKLKVVPIRSILAAPRKATSKMTAANPKPRSNSKAIKSAPPPSIVPILGVGMDLVWESKPLTRRDLTIPDGANTHATGSINLDKGLMDESVDHRHYFKDDVFFDLTWRPTNSSGNVIETYAKFQIVLKNVSFGEFDLRIAHSTSTTSKSYYQRNAMTRLSWGAARDYIARPDLIGRTLALYRDKADPQRFILEID